MNNRNKPAFPIFYNDQDLSLGISKREYFAAMAMQGLLANAHTHANGEQIEGAHPSRIAVSAVHYADALLEILTKIDQ